MKEVVTKVIDTLPQEDFYGAFQKLLERYNKCITAGGDYFEGDLNFMWVLSIKVFIQKSLETYRMPLVCLIYMYLQDLALNNLQWLICRRTQPNNHFSGYRLRSYPEMPGGGLASLKIYLVGIL